MVTIAQVQKGFARFVDTQVAGLLSGWQKAIVIGGATLLANNLPKLAAAYAAHPMVAALGVINTENGAIDIDALYTAFVPHMGADKIPLAVPGVGTLKLGKEEIDILVKYIKEA